MFENLPPESSTLHRLRRERRIGMIIFACFCAVAALVAVLGGVLRPE